MTFWPLAHSTWDKQEISAARRVLESGRTTMGVCVEKFEQEFARYHGMPYAVMVNSGSSANLIATAALCSFMRTRGLYLRQDDWVIVPALAWATTYYPLLQHGLKLFVADVDLETLNIDIGRVVNTSYGPHPHAIVGVSILGDPAPLDAIWHYAERNGMIMMEDNCESLGAVEPITSNLTGTFGLTNTFSFFYSHHISTMEGGMILTRDEEVYELCKSLRNHGWTRGLKHIWSGDATDEFNEAYRFILPGYNVRPLEICGAIGLEQLRKLPAMNMQRRKNWTLFHKLFKDDERFIIQRQDGKSQPFGFTMICRDKRSRPLVFSKLRAAGIEFRMITGGNFLRHPVAQAFADRISGDCPNADVVHDRGFFIGNHPYDLSRQINRLKEILK